MLRYANYSFLMHIVVDMGVCVNDDMSRRIYVQNSTFIPTLPSEYL